MGGVASRYAGDGLLGTPLCYDDIEHDIQTGDLVLFAGGSQMSHIIEFATDSCYSHVAIAIRGDPPDEICKNGQSSRVYLLESAIASYTAQHCYVRGIKHSGVRLVDAKTRIDNYAGTVVSIRHLGHASDECRRAMTRTLWQLADELCRHAKYDSTGMAVLWAVRPRLALFLATICFTPRHARAGYASPVQECNLDHRSFHCASLVGHCLQECCFLTPRVDKHRFVPELFAETSDSTLRSMELGTRHSGCQYGREIHIQPRFTSREQAML